MIFERQRRGQMRIVRKTGGEIGEQDSGDPRGAAAARGQLGYT